MKIVAILCFAAFFAISGPGQTMQRELPLPTGVYRVGTSIAHLTDKNRMDTIKPAPDHFRELMIQFWYPTDQTQVSKPAQYLPDARILPELVRSQYDLQTSDVI